MLMALLFNEDDAIAAAAPACDQFPLGDRYWAEIHQGHIDFRRAFETAYVTVTSPELQTQLLRLGTDDQLDGQVLADQIESLSTPRYWPGRAA